MRTVTRRPLPAGMLVTALAALLVALSAAPAVAGPLTGAAAGTAQDGRAERDKEYDWGTIRSARDHSGHAKARVWVTGFGERRFQVYGRLYDLDRHPDHCASIRARFHYVKGGTGWSPYRRYCASSRSDYAGYLLESRGLITRVDLRICLSDGLKGRTSYCRTETVRNEDFAW
ncbi:hypothetical protein [Planobispora longispora]|uniref:Secreted protein n=1 Tax=Planobispora longispora TaxID=28887 RepID=A0A8J3W7S5_9ACTN|nr:hypothetical protein [Planobispora longispora]BFE79574.1 hypothetical protein GCM10020093_021750 [Planobispora longispora]GIH78121.1 hypothetical protein Plo01_45500 [Planobispora longispora]